jgi:nucleoside-diphosphate-sugar epimerase
MLRVGRHEDLDRMIESYLEATGTEDLFQRVLISRALAEQMACFYFESQYGINATIFRPSPRPFLSAGTARYWQDMVNPEAFLTSSSCRPA